MIRLTFLFVLISTGLFAQNAALFPVGKQSFWYANSSGQPLPGGFVYTCVAGTSCAAGFVGGPPLANGLPTYTDSTAGTANPNPIVLDAAGQAQIWGPCSSVYKVIVQNYQGIVQYSADNVSPPGPCGSSISGNPLYVDLAMQPGAVVNSPSTCNDSAFNSAITAAIAGPGFVLVPAGTWYTCATIAIPAGIMIAGPGHWSQEPEFGTVQNAVVKAGSTFSVGSGYQSHMFVLGGTSGTSGPSGYGTRIENMSIDGSGIADGVYVAHTQEHTGMAFVDILNFPRYGVYVCGSDAGGPCGSNQPTGAQSDGDYHDMQITPDDSYGMTATTIPIYVNNADGQREWRNINIDPVAHSSGNRPVYGMVIWGTGYSIKHLHVEAIQTTGLFISPGPSVCPGACGGTIGATFEDINVSNVASGANAVTIGPEANVSENFINVSSDGGPTCLIAYSFSTYSGCVNGTENSGNWWVDANGIPEGFAYPITFTAGVTATVGLELLNGTNPQLDLEGASPTFGHNSLQGLGAGDLTFAGTVAASGWNFQKSFWPLSIYQSNQYQGLNLQWILQPANQNTRTAICGNVYWNNTSGNWLSGGNGGSDYSCLLDLQNGYGLSLSSSGASGTGTPITNNSMFSNMAWVVNKPNGHMIFGPGSVSSGGTVNDQAGQIQTPSAGDTTDSNSDLSGTLVFSSSSTSDTYNFLHSGGQHPICTMTGDFLNGYIYINYGGGANSWTITAHSNTSNSGNVSYICVLKP